MEGLTNVKVARKRIYKLFQYASNKDDDIKNNNDVKGSIIFENVLYGKKSGPLLNEVSFLINEHNLVVLTGNISNCQGVFDLLLGYNKQHHGCILIDNINVENYSKENISNIIGFVMEYPMFFSTTIRENLMIFDSNFENIVNMCKSLDIHDYIMSLSSGYETILNNDASNIDGDVKYLLALARVLLVKSKIILLDEILDKVSNDIKKQIIKIIKDIKDEHTILLISRDRTIMKSKYVDKILVFSKGKVIGNNLYKEVMKDDTVAKIFKRM